MKEDKQMNRKESKTIQLRIANSNIILDDNREKTFIQNGLINRIQNQNKPILQRSMAKILKISDSYRSNFISCSTLQFVLPEDIELERQKLKLLKERSKVELNSFVNIINFLYDFDKLRLELSTGKSKDYKELYNELFGILYTAHDMIKLKMENKVIELTPKQQESIEVRFTSMGVNPKIYRKELISQGIQAIGQFEDPFYIRTMIFANNKLIHQIEPKISRARSPEAFPRNYMSYMSCDGLMKSQSRDAEMFIIDEVNKTIGRFVHYRASEIEKGDEIYEFRIELIGPKGTCTDCQIGLSEFLDRLKLKSRLAYNNHLTFILITRWIVESPSKPINSKRPKRIYGSPDAKYKNGSYKLKF